MTIKLKFEIAHLYGNCFLMKIGEKITMIYLQMDDNDLDD